MMEMEVLWGKDFSGSGAGLGKAATTNFLVSSSPSSSSCYFHSFKKSNVFPLLLISLCICNPCTANKSCLLCVL